MKFRGANKYRARRTSCGLHEHASKSEAIRCSELQLMEKGGIIRILVHQPEFVFEMNNVKICTYRADWSYRDGKMPYGASPLVVEDCKGFKTPVYRLKKKMMKAFYGIDIKETS